MTTSRSSNITIPIIGAFFIAAASGLLLTGCNEEKDTPQGAEISTEATERQRTIVSQLERSDLKQNYFLTDTFEVVSQKHQRRMLVTAKYYCEAFDDMSLNDYREACRTAIQEALEIRERVYDYPLETTVPTDNPDIRKTALWSEDGMIEYLGGAGEQNAYIVKSIEDIPFNPG